MKTRVRVGVVGVNGYSGLELARLLIGHPGAELTYVAASKDAPGGLEEEQPFLRGARGLRVTAHDPAVCTAACDFVFVALPSGSSGRVALELRERGLRVIDLSGDLRLPAADYEVWYGHAALPQWGLDEAVYGLTEWRREDIRGAGLIANPGCYATAAELALLPIVNRAKDELKLQSTPIIIDAKSGVSGAGRKAAESRLLGELAENFYAYKVGRHQHTPEIERQLSAAGDAVRVLLTTQLLPTTRGIYISAYVQMGGAVSASQVWSLYQSCYESEPFVRVLPPGQVPQLKHVRGSNYCDIGFCVDERTGVLQVFCVIDNLQKGAAGQAVQNFNVMNGFVETSGLLAQPLYP